MSPRRNHWTRPDLRERPNAYQGVQCVSARRAGNSRDGQAWPPEKGPVPGAAFRNTLFGVQVHRSARRHGVDDDDVVHAVANAMAIEDAGANPDRWLVIGPDRAGNLLEVVVMITAEGDEIAIHAMPMRPQYRRLLER